MDGTHSIFFFSAIGTNSRELSAAMTKLMQIDGRLLEKFNYCTPLPKETRRFEVDMEEQSSQNSGIPGKFHQRRDKYTTKSSGIKKQKIESPIFLQFVGLEIQRNEGPEGDNTAAAERKTRALNCENRELSGFRISLGTSTDISSRCNRHLLETTTGCTHSLAEE